MVRNFQCVRIIGKTIFQYSIYLIDCLLLLLFFISFWFFVVWRCVFDLWSIGFVVPSIFCDLIYPNCDLGGIYTKILTTEMSKSNWGKKSHKPIIMRTYVSWCFRASSPQNINTYGIAYFQMPTPYTAYIVSWFFTSVFIQRFLHFQL